MALISGPTVAGAIGDGGNELAKLVAAEKDDKKLVDDIFLRVLNRPARESEIAAGLKLIQELPMYHEQLTAELKDYEANLEKRNAEKEKLRLEAIAAATAEIAAHEAAIAEREKKLDDEHNQKIVAVETALKAYEQQLPAKLEAWEKQLNETTSWKVLDPAELSATNNAKFEKQDDSSVFVSGPNGKGSYKVVAKTDVTAITGIKLEALNDDRLPAKGPGRAQNGNFVLTEFRVEHAEIDKPDQKKAVVLQNAQADFSQQGYDVKTAIDDQKTESNNGWATAPQFGQTRTAVFETKENIGGGLLTFWFDQEYADGQHSIGRFRISVTSSPRPVRLDGLPKNVADILAVAGDKRSDKQKSDLLSFYRGVDAELKKLQEAVAEAKKPRPVDPKLQQLRLRLTSVSQPLPADPKLDQLRTDVGISKQQLENARLTAAQDLTWALINSPAFLFNH